MKICIVQFGCLKEYVQLYSNFFRESSSLDPIDIEKFVQDKQSWLNLSIENHKAYCNQHSYSYHFHELQKIPRDRSSCWHKIKAIQEAMQDSSVDWVFYCDLDTLVMNNLVKLEDIIHSAEILGKDLILPETKDFLSREMNSELKIVEKGINAGHFFIKNCEWAKVWLEKFWNFPTDYVKHNSLLQARYHDNCALNIMLSSNVFETDANSIKAPNRMFNSYYKCVIPEDRGDKTNGDFAAERAETFYKDGDFKIHFAGYNFEQRQFLLESYAEGKAVKGTINHKKIAEMSS